MVKIHELGKHVQKQKKQNFFIPREAAEAAEAADLPTLISPPSP
jgi:hypothetical protein